MKSFSRLLLAFGLSLLLVSVLWGQGFTVTITATDGPSNSMDLTLGTAVGATLGIDAPLGEQELPPVPPGNIFDVRFQGFGLELGVGTKVDIVPAYRAEQSDSFLVALQASSEAAVAGQITLTWDNVSAVGGGYWHILDAGTGHDIVDMVAHPSVDINVAAHPYILIVHGDATSYLSFGYDRFYSDVMQVTGKAGAHSKSQPRVPKPKAGATLYPPNINNVGEEIGLEYGAIKQKVMFSVGVFVPAVDPKSKIAQHVGVDVAAWKSIMADAYTINKKVAAGFVQHSADSNNFCLDVDHYKKWKAPKGSTTLAPIPLTAQLKSLPPVKGAQQNFLFAQLLTLKFNILASQWNRTPSLANGNPVNFGGLVYNDPASPLNGKSVAAIAAHADSVLSCIAVGTTETKPELCVVLKKINEAFDNGRCDTAAGHPFHSAAKPVKPAVLHCVLAGSINLYSVPFLYVPAPSNAPLSGRNVAGEMQPEQYQLNQNYPNPFNPTTNISFNLVNSGLVTVKVFNMLGQEVGTLLNKEEMSAGVNEVSFDASSLASGVYFYRVVVNDVQNGKVMFQDVKKMMLVK